ncbi:MAG: HhH-GPD-type base excision DNA repair protein [Streptomycetales bacterium]
MNTSPPLCLTQNPEADALLSRDPLALLVGMLLDQQVPMEWAFSAPLLLVQRLGGSSLDAVEIAGYDPDAFASLAAGPPAIHRYPGSMAGRIQALCRYLVEHYETDTVALWRDVPSGAELLRRLRALPGFGEQKAKIFLALLGKQIGVQPAGWRVAAGSFGEHDVRRSVADITGAETLAEVRAYKQEMKRAAKKS